MNLLADNLAWIPDVVFGVLLLLGLIIGAKRGFIRGICKLAGSFLSAFIALFFCIPLSGKLEEWFSLSTTLANSMNPTLAGILVILISFVSLIIAVRLIIWIIALIGKAIVNASKALGFVDHVLGAILGLAKALLIVSIILLVFSWLNIEVVNNYINASYVVSKFYDSEFFAWIASLPAQLMPSTEEAALFIK